MATSQTCSEATSIDNIPKGLFTRWDVTDLRNWLVYKGLNETAAGIFEEQKICGELLLPRYVWNHEKLARMGIDNEGDRELCLSAIEALQRDLSTLKAKTFQDVLYGSVEIHPLLVKIIDTPQFQRLRDIKQLGGAHYVFPSASHSRFEHSIGVCHLAGVFIENLQCCQPELGISDIDVLCIKMAALCHDMGHGPLSAFYQDLFMPEMHEDKFNWKHEQTSLNMIDYMIQVNTDLQDMLKLYGIDWEHEQTFVHELILGSPLKEEDRFEGRDKSKYFLYEIVANKFNLIDVDKMDSLLRDAQALGITVHFDWRRFIQYARVARDESGQPHICPSEEDVREVFLFRTFRDHLYQDVYQHHTKRAVELMILDVLKIANDHLKIPGTEGALVQISDAIHDMEAFTRLTDGILYSINIFTSDNPELLKAKKILDEIDHRKLYMFVGSVRVFEARQKSLLYDLDLQSMIAKQCLDMNAVVIPETNKLLPELVKFDFGFNKKSQMHQVWFHSKQSPDKPINIKKKNIPRRIEEWEVRVYYTEHDPDIREVTRSAFHKLCDSEGLTGLFEDVKLPTMDPAESVYSLSVPPRGGVKSGSSSSRKKSRSPAHSTKPRPSVSGQEPAAAADEKCTIS